MRDDKILRIYTDGGCSGNQNEENVGGWGAILEYGPAVKELYGGAVNTTNNRMEMTALLSAFQAIKKGDQSIQVFSDSGYLMDCFRQKWYVNWLKNGWKNAQKKPVENKDLWEQLLPFLLVVKPLKVIKLLDSMVGKMAQVSDSLNITKSVHSQNLLTLLNSICKFQHSIL